MRISVASSGHISVKFGIGNLCENLSRKPLFGKNQAEIFGTLHEDLSTVCFCQWYLIVVRALS